MLIWLIVVLLGAAVSLQLAAQRPQSLAAEEDQPHPEEQVLAQLDAKLHNWTSLPARTGDQPAEDGSSSRHRRWAPTSTSTVWDLGPLPRAAGSGTPPPHWLPAPRFGVEPPPLVEFSNSTGAVIPCRPHSAADQRRTGATSAPVSISWRLVGRLPDEVLSQTTGDQPEDRTEQPDEQPATPQGRLRSVRPDGALVLGPFRAEDFRPELHRATYRCCLANRFGQLCSRPVRVRAEIDSAPNLEVFDEFVLAGNAVILRCQAPSHLDRHLEHVAWLKDDKSLVTAAANRQLGLGETAADERFPATQVQGRPRHLPSGGGGSPFQPMGVDPAQVLDAPQPPSIAQKYLMLQTGELLIRDAGKSDAANYKCRARHRLTGALITSKIGGQLMVDDSAAKSAPLRQTGSAPLLWAREGSPVFVCARFQSLPVPTCSWFWQPEVGAPRRPLDEAQQPEVRPLQPHASCLYVQQAQRRHAGLYTCEAANGAEPSQSSTSRLVVSSAQLSAQLLVSGHSSSPLVQGPPGQGSGDRIKQPPTGQQQQQLQIAQLGASLQLNCSISGHPYEWVAWFKDSRLIGAWGAQQQTNSTTGAGRLMVQPPAGTSKQTGSRNNLKLVQPTVITIERFALGDRGLYQCQVYSSRTPNVSELAVGGAISSAGVPGPHSSGQIEWQLERDYLRSASASVQLDVAFSKPTLALRFAAQTQVSRGGSVSLQCGAHALPRARILWFLDNQPIGQPPAAGERRQTVVVDSAGPDAAAAAAEGEAEELYLASELPGLEASPGGSTVELLPSLIALQLNVPHRMTTDNAGETADAEFPKSPNLLHYELIGDERFLISTHLSGQMLVSQLNVSQVSGADSGQYRCAAVNALGSSWHSGQVSVLGAGLELRHYQPANVTLVAGKSASLQCPLVGFPLARVDWFRDGQRLPSSHRQRQEPIKGGWGGQLELANVDRAADAGLYTCRASLDSSQQQQRFHQSSEQAEGLVGQVNVQVRVAPLIDAQSLPEVVQANEGMRTKLVCSVVQGDHPVEIRWLRRASGGGASSRATAQVGRLRVAGMELMQNSADGDSHEESVTIHNLEDSCLLTFKRISYADSADYLCLAQNEVGQTMRWTRVVVNVAPSWSTEPSGELSVMLGARLQLDCLAHGFPTPSVTWKRQLNSRQAGEQQEPPEEQPLAGQQQAAAGGEYTDLVSGFRQRIHSNGSLIVEQVEQLDGGNYMCEVANGIGTGLSKILRVRVNVPPYFRQRTAAQLSQLDSRAELRCVAYGDQPMVIGWRREQGDVVDLVNDNRHRQVSEHRLSAQAHESVLVLQALARNDSGQYVCVASNEFGTEETRLRLLVQEPPEAPVLMRPIRASSRQATLSFRAPFAGNSPIRKYAILFRQITLGQVPMGLMMMTANEQADQWTGNASSNNNSGWQQVLVEAPNQQQQPNLDMVNFAAGPSARQLFVSQNSTPLVNLNLCCLQPYSRYMVRVRAINDIGQSESSKVAHLVTDEEAIGGPPLDVGVETTGAHSLKVRWRAPARNLQNGLIRGYYIGYRVVGNPATAGPSPGGSNTAALELLLQQRTGTQAHTSTSQNVKVMEGPAVGATGDSGEQYQYKNVQLDFSAPNFQLQQFSSPSVADNEQQSLLSNASSLLMSAPGAPQPQVYTSYLTNLRRKTAYSIIVQAYNKIGAGPRSDQIIVSTLDAAPPMSPVLKLVSVSYNSALLTWSGRRFGAAFTSDNSSSVSQSRIGGASPIGPAAEAEQQEDGEDDDPHYYYTLNYRTDDPLRGARNSEAGLAGGRSGSSDDDWQQRRLPKRQPLPYVLNNLRCGSHHTAFMTATNSLGQSEPGESVRFTTMGAAPVAPASARDFLQVNSTYALLRLALWQGAGCTIGSFLLKYRASSQLKWTIIEHQLHPTVQTVTISGSAIFSTQPLSGGGSPVAAGDAATRLGNQQQQQTGGDLVIRNLLAGLTYRLVVEANSEAGATVAEYEFDTANYSASTISVTVNGISASESQLMMRNQQLSHQQGRSLGQQDNLEGILPANSELDFGYSNAGQRPLGGQRGYTLGVWSLTALFVVASVLMAGTALVLGLKSVMRTSGGGTSTKGAPNQRLGGGSHLLCCLSSGTSSSGSSGGADSNSSSGGGTCYQVSEHPNHALEAYCAQLTSGAAGGLQMIDSNPNTLRGAAHARLNSISNSDIMLESCGQEAGELKSVMALADALPFRHQLVSSSSLSTIGAAHLAATPGGGPNSSLTKECRNTHTLASHCHQRRRFSGHEHSPGGQSPHQVSHFRAAQYAATLGKQHSSFGTGGQPLKYNSSTLYGRLQPAAPKANQQQQQQVGDQYATGETYHQFQLLAGSSSGTTSGYETSGANSARLVNGGSSELGAAECQSQVYLQNPQDHTYNNNSHHQMSLYGQAVNGMLPGGEGNLFTTSGAANPHRVSSLEMTQETCSGPPPQDHHFQHYSLPGGKDGTAATNGSGYCQEPQTTGASLNDYGMLIGSQQEAGLKSAGRLDQNYHHHQQQQDSLTHHHLQQLLLAAAAHQQQQQQQQQQ